jgi:hypothetical protein
MLRSAPVWVAALWVAVMIHLDWHLGRHGDDHRSFDFAYHWLLALPAFLPVAWLAGRKWSGAAVRAAGSITLMGMLLGQGLEPLGETVFLGAGTEPFTDPLRWKIFAEFMAAGFLVLLLSVPLVRRRAP